VVTTLIRVHEGRETPGPGRWIIAAGTRCSPRSVTAGGTAPTVAGSLLITDAGAVAFQLIVD
jgi:hypothetical protein